MITKEEIELLRVFIEEQARGIQHTYDWIVKMKDIQARLQAYGRGEDEQSTTR